MAYLITGIGMWAVVRAVENGVTATIIWLDRNKPITDPWIAEFRKGMKERGERPPPYAAYATGWGLFGAGCIGAGLQLWW
jgi:hypothetical protein